MADTAAAARPVHAVGMVPIVMLFGTGTIWGGVVSVAKFGITHGVSPFAYGMWTMLGGGLFVLIVCAFRRRLPPVNPRYLRYYLLTGLVRVGIPNGLFYVVLRHIPAGVMAMLMTLTPMFTYGLALGFGSERYVAARFAGIACGFSGALLLVLPKGSLPDPAMAWWVVLGFGTPFFYAVANLVIDRLRPPEADMLALASATLFSGGLFLMPLALIFGTLHVVWPPLGPGDYAILAHSVMSGLCFMGQFELIRRAGPVFSSQLSSLIPLSGVFWGMIAFDERHSAWVWGALALVLAGVVMVNRRQEARLK